MPRFALLYYADPPVSVVYYLLLEGRLISIKSGTEDFDLTAPNLPPERGTPEVLSSLP